MTLTDLKTKTLNQVSDMLTEGRISEDLAREYCALWNNGPHFTRARLSMDGTRILNYEDIT